MPPSLATRKPVDKLMVPDLEAFPVWEFASDEEAVEGMDETWVKPVGHIVPEHESAVTVAAVFRLNCGLVYPGMVWCNTYAAFEVTAIALLTSHAYSARSRTPFRCDGGQHSAVMADTVPR
jgi:hypothetical protein